MIKNRMVLSELERNILRFNNKRQECNEKEKVRIKLKNQYRKGELLVLFGLWLCCLFVFSKISADAYFSFYNKMPLWQKELLFKYFLTDMDKILGYGFHGQFNDAVVFDAILPDDLKKSILKTFYTVLHKKTCSDVALACVGLLE